MIFQHATVIQVPAYSIWAILALFLFTWRYPYSLEGSKFHLSNSWLKSLEKMESFSNRFWKIVQKRFLIRLVKCNTIQAKFLKQLKIWELSSLEYFLKSSFKIFNRIKALSVGWILYKINIRIALTLNSYWKYSIFKIVIIMKKLTISKTSKTYKLAIFK